MSSPSSSVAPKKLVYKGSVYRLARTQEDIALEHIADLSQKIHEITTAKGSVIDKRGHVGNLLAEMTQHLRVLGLRSPLI